jgi:hypothetical protein
MISTILATDRMRSMVSFEMPAMVWEGWEEVISC